MIRERALVLDAEALSALIDERKDGHEAARAVLAALVGGSPDGASLFLVPAIALYEVRRGLLKVSAARRIRDLDRFVRAYAAISDFDEQAAVAAATVWAERARKGRPAGEKDVLILGSAIARKGDVVTRDAGFPVADGVRAVSWAALAASLGE